MMSTQREYTNTKKAVLFSFVEVIAMMYLTYYKIPLAASLFGLSLQLRLGDKLILCQVLRAWSFFWQPTEDLLGQSNE